MSIISVLNNDLNRIIYEYIHRSSWNTVMDELISCTEGIKTLLTLYSQTQLHKFYLRVCEIQGCINWDYDLKQKYGVWGRCVCYFHLKNRKMIPELQYKERK